MDTEGRKGSAVLVIILIVFILLAAGAFWYYEANKSSTPTVASNTVAAASSSQTNQAHATATAVESSSSVGSALTVTPISGTSPLAVIFRGVVSGPIPDSDTGIGPYEFGIDFGDNNRSFTVNNNDYGASDATGVVVPNCPGTPNDSTNYTYPNSCPFSPIHHIYTYGGTYTATLWQYSQNGTETELGTTTITVNGPLAPDDSVSLSAIPSSTAPGQPVTFTTGNGGHSNTAYYVDFGDNSMKEYGCGQNLPDGPVDAECLPKSFQHTYAGNGTSTYTVTLYEDDGNFDNSPIVGTTTVTVSGNDPLPGPTCTLTVTPRAVASGQDITISWTTQDAYTEGPSGDGAWTGGEGDGILEEMSAPTALNGSETVIATGTESQELDLEINGPGGDGEGSCSTTITIIGN